ncbi:MAG: SH3 domain-containing protein [Vallitalea sp.]|nr:SH3 domain-containing protein [Vallitalea sp.]
MKRLGMKQLTIGLISGLMLSTNTYASTIGTVNVENLNVRSGPSLTNSIVDYVHLGDTLEILSTNNDWYKINITQLDEAYVHSKYVNLQENKERIIISEEAELRNSPVSSSSLITLLPSGEKVKLVYQTGDWFYASTNKGNGYIHMRNLSATKVTSSLSLSQTTKKTEAKTKKFAKVTTSILNVRAEPSTSSKKINKVYRYNTFEVLSELDKWVSIKLSNGSTGYVYKDYVTLTDEISNTNTLDLRQQVVAYSKQFLGNRYVWGGNSLTRGVDCSGFTQQIMKKFGIYINRTSRTQINNGYRVSKNNLLPGDLVFFGHNKRINHVAMYIGNNQIIHANNPKTGIIINALNDRRMAPYIGASRVIK